jgi:F-type H+-transporting ATPase subunit a
VNPEIFTEGVIVRLGPLPVTATMVTSAVTSALLLLCFGLLGRAVVQRPDGRLAAAGRLSFGFLRELVTGAVGRPSAGLEIFSGSLFLFIAGAAVIGQLPGVATPTANLAATSALAVLVFLAVPIVGIRVRGVRGYLDHYLRPNPLLFPLHIISEISRTLALALRLFGNMMSGHLMVALLVSLAGILVPVPLMALDLLIGFLQAYIFTILASVYIGAAIRVGEGERGEQR